MAAAEILATGSTGVSSGDITIAAGTLVGLKGEALGANVEIEVKDDAGGYHKIGALTSSTKTYVVAGGGLYRFTRSAGIACGVFSA